MPAKPTDIKTAVRRVLEKANAKFGQPVFLSAYQILDLLPKQTKQRLIRAYGLGGKDNKAGNGSRMAAPSVVMKALLMLRPDVEICLFESKKVVFTIDGQPVEPSPPSCHVYRLKAQVRRPRRQAINQGPETTEVLPT